MASEPQILYLEPDDEITSVVRRVRQTDAPRIILVAPARTRATSSAVALRLLAAVAAEEGRTLTLVADPLARTLAAEAGISAFSSVADATLGAAVAGAPEPAPRAAIRVVRPDAPSAPSAPQRARSSRTDETRAVPVVGPAVPPPAARKRLRTRPTGRRTPPARGRWRLMGVGVVVLALLLVGTAAGVVLPAATVHLTPATRTVGPVTYRITVSDPAQDAGELPLAMPGRATGDHVERVAASGSVTFENWNYRKVNVPKGTQVAAGDVVFVTTDGLTIPSGKLTGHGTITSGSGSVTVVAAEPGPAGNVAAGAINRIVDRRLAGELRGFPSTLALVHNDAPTAGGAENHQPQVQQSDVDAVKQQIIAGLQEQLAKHFADAAAEFVIGPPTTPEEPQVSVPDGLVGAVGEETFKLSGTVSWERLATRRDDLEDAAKRQLLDDPARVTDGTSLVPASVRVVSVGEAQPADGQSLVVPVSVTAAATPSINADAIRARIAGLTADEAQAELAEIGTVRVELWPGWVTHVPSMGWRVSIELPQATPASLPPAASP